MFSAQHSSQPSDVVMSLLGAQLALLARSPLLAQVGTDQLDRRRVL